MRFIVYVDGRGGLINPTLSEYVIAREVYVTDESKLKNFGVGNNGIELGGVNFEGPFEKRHDLFIDKTDLRRARTLPKEKVVAHVDSSGGQIVAKVFTAPDFIAYVEEGMGEPGAFKRQQPAGYVAPAFSPNRPRPACRHWTPPSRRTPRRCARSMRAG